MVIAGPSGLHSQAASGTSANVVWEQIESYGVGDDGQSLVISVELPSPEVLLEHVPASMWPSPRRPDTQLCGVKSLVGEA